MTLQERIEAMRVAVERQAERAPDWKGEKGMIAIASNLQDIADEVGLLEKELALIEELVT